MEPRTALTTGKESFPLLEKLRRLIKAEAKSVIIVQDFAALGAVNLWHRMDNKGHATMHFQGSFLVTNPTDMPLVIAEIDCKRPTASRIFHVRITASLLEGSLRQVARQRRGLKEEPTLREVVPPHSAARAVIDFALDPAPRRRGELKLKLLIRDNTGKRHKVPARFLPAVPSSK